MIKKLISLIVLALLTSSCMVYHIDSVDSTDNYYPSKPASEVVYIEEVDQPLIDLLPE